ncbi:16S rRNA (guanine(527)-N(7))-methyltransferase RsmG [Leuconostoc mesenteroides]|uniref:Ribosomal RNA small subunit methyltransferase G n=1 Tax=Leuconostoc mesenteroides subsp. cremoris ATCC 19254 TaxID=586220 RepID=C2KLS3_LEUMC|nr:16S rRNA (guanine(527)-N(7))-methyltransferase RsmG [Leuconostoc mesenteroides]KDA51031.1 rRNA small subunit 7-methylguanosine (m7G) methyltransferase GidB [Leuconostoc mesenteroides subsp. cremoris T26]EEJ41817.1 16S rRNA methyltransferase GidB [Leuconostoc mesenteroides subsp. cremoris ATCC 19254]ORI47895.1 16S rRNA (guanine(527)-N(7))-methyltransferase RsmG [Leuconostoc mesenteroides subsp. cremoris]ORI48958.1 16S rRNA (guanine(527)-N(7))-methyltransferase RsmG [Leuconostoc mesenteroides 
MTNEDFIEALSSAGITLTTQQVRQFERYYELLVATNEHVNLTAITEKKDVYLKHFYDSLTVAMYEQKLKSSESTLIDIGTGAGFPSLPLKIAFPDLKITMVDALKKRVNFLQEVVDTLDLTGVEIVHGRAEDIGQNPKYRENFDYATARAVARTSVLAEYTLPFVKIGGRFLVMKGSAAYQELLDGQKALAMLGGQVNEEFVFKLPNGDQRYIQIVDKKTKTPKKYPRQAGTPSKKPIS